MNLKQAIKNSIGWNKSLAQLMKKQDRGLSNLKKSFFDLNLSQLQTQMTALHYACEFPSLTMIVDLLSQSSLDPLSLNYRLKMPSELIPLSHLTSKKCVVIIEKDWLIRRFFSMSIYAEPLSQFESVTHQTQLEVPAEKDFDFDIEDKDHNQPTTQRPRCFPAKKSFLVNMKIPSERVIGRVVTEPTDRENGRGILIKKGERSLQDFQTLRKSLKIDQSTALGDKKPLRISLNTTPALQIKAITAIKSSAGEKAKLQEQLSLRIDRVFSCNTGINCIDTYVRKFINKYKE